MTKSELKRIGTFKAVRVFEGVTLEEQKRWIAEVRNSLDEQGADTKLENGNIVCNSGQLFRLPSLSSEEEGTIKVRSSDIVFTDTNGATKYCGLKNITITDNIITVKDTSTSYILTK